MTPLRRKVCLAFAGGCAQAFTPAFARPKQAKMIYIITFRGKTDVEKGFRAYLSEHRYDIEYIERDLGRDNSRFPSLLAEIRSLKPDLILTWGTTVTEGIVGKYNQIDPKVHITDIPVVFTLVAAPVSAELVPNLASSGRNVTGVYHVATTESQVRAMAAYRGFKRVGVLYTSTENNSLAILGELKALGKSMDFEVLDRPFKLDATNKPVTDQVPEMLKEMKERGAEWLYLPPDSFLGSQSRDIVIPAAHRLELPTFASTEQIMDAGALAGLISRYYGIGQFTGYKASQILFGNRLPSQVPIETLTRYSFIIRMPVAKQLKRYPPLSMFNSAEIIQ
jgi:putative tryptophan/tyrosine transport system substrate-binding protein